MEKIYFSSINYDKGYADLEFFVGNPSENPSFVGMMIDEASLELKDCGKMWKVDLDICTTNFGHVSYKIPGSDIKEFSEETVTELFPELAVTEMLTTLIYFAILGSVARAFDFERCRELEGTDSAESEFISNKVEYITEEAPLPYVHMVSSFSSLKDGLTA